MSQNIKFKSENDNSNFNNPQFKRNLIKSKIMEKYNISSTEAEKFLSELEKKEINKLHKKQNKTEDYESKPSLKNNDCYNVVPGSNLDIKHDVNSSAEHNFDKKSEDILFSNNNDIETKKTILLNTEDRINDENSKSVDTILEDIIPNYNQQISIEVNHVDLTFEVSNEKIDTLKETFIRTFKKDKSKKIKIHALKDVSFQIYKGEKVGIIGYNGAGKSTLLNVITGIYPPDKGSVTTHGKISPLLSLGAGFDYNYSGRKNIILNGAVLGYDRTFLESKIDEIIEFSELGEFIDIPIKNYSSGMLAKLGFSIATAVNPDILIVDEVLGVGDVNFAKKSRDKIRSLMDGGTTVLLVSHSIPQIRELCDKAIWIDKGNLREMGEVNKICDHYLKDAEKASNEQLANIQFR